MLEYPHEHTAVAASSSFCFRTIPIGRFFSLRLWAKYCAQRYVTRARSISRLLPPLQRPIRVFSAVLFASARRVSLTNLGEQSVGLRKSDLPEEKRNGKLSKTHWIRRSRSDNGNMAWAAPQVRCMTCNLVFIEYSITSWINQNFPWNPCDCCASWKCICRIDHVDLSDRSR